MKKVELIAKSNRASDILRSRQVPLFNFHIERTFVLPIAIVAAAAGLPSTNSQQTSASWWKNDLPGGANVTRD